MKHTLSLPRICPWLLAGAVACAHGASYGVNAKWPLPGEGGWDYPSIDSERHLLYLSRATHVSVVDTKTGAAVAEIGDTPGVHGIALAGDLGRGFISVGKADRVKVFDLATRAVIADIDVGMKPDAILYDPFSHQVFAFNGRAPAPASSMPPRTPSSRPSISAARPNSRAPTARAAFTSIWRIAINSRSWMPHRAK